jgi:hypothetical protein
VTKPVFKPFTISHAASIPAVTVFVAVSLQMFRTYMVIDAINATIYTDEHMPYRTLPKLGFKHTSVNHGVKEFVNGMASTNTAEGFWSHLKRGINGIYHHVSAKHLQRYCDEYSYRWNTRGMTDGERFEDWFSHVNGKRLTYDSLTSKQH